MIRSWLIDVDPEIDWQPESASDPARLAAATPVNIGKVRAREKPLILKLNPPLRNHCFFMDSQKASTEIAIIRTQIFLPDCFCQFKA